MKQVIDNHDYPDEAAAHRLLPGVDPTLQQNTLNTELKFNPNYYRIYTAKEIEEAEEANVQDPSQLSKAALSRRASQKQIAFPVRPEDIDRDLLSPPNAQTTEDSDNDSKP